MTGIYQGICNTAWRIASTVTNLPHLIDVELRDYSRSTIAASAIAGTAAVTTGVAAASTVVPTFAAFHFLRKAYNAATKDNIAMLLAKAPLSLTLKGKPIMGQKLKAKMDKEIADATASMENDVAKLYAPYTRYDDLPEQGLSDAEILARFPQESLVDRYRQSGAVYTEYSPNELALLKEVWARTALTNPIHMDANPQILLCIAEMIHLLQKAMNGDPNAAGIMTNGGTFSIIEAVTSLARLKREQGIEKPEIIIPETAHAAFIKAADIAGLKLITVPVDKVTGAVDVAAVESKITPRTCLIVGSAPSFPNGVYDNIKALSDLAKKRNVFLHVDACLGGWLNMWAKDAKQDIPLCDLSKDLDGITTMSLDSHKYGYTPKGTSTLLYGRNCPKQLCAHLITKWTGGLYPTPSESGSGNGSSIATAWAVMFSRGKEYYRAEATKIFKLRNELNDQINALADVKIAHETHSSVLAIVARPNSKINILDLESEMSKLGWKFNTGQTTDQKSHRLQFTLTALHTTHPDYVKFFMDDMKKALVILNDPTAEKAKTSGTTQIYKATSKFVPDALQQTLARTYLESQMHFKPGPAGVATAAATAATGSDHKQELRPN